MIMFSKTNKAYQKIMVSLFSIMFLHSTLFFYALFVLFIIRPPARKKEDTSNYLVVTPLI